MANDGASTVQAVAMRLTRLGSTGAPVSGTKAGYVTDAFTYVTFTPQYEAGEEFSDKNAKGDLCVYFKTDDVLKRIDIEVAICAPDPEIEEMLAGGTVILDGSDPIGWAPAPVGTAGNPNGVGIEVWSRAVVAGKQAADLPYWHWLFPLNKLRPTGERRLQNGLMVHTFSGEGYANAEFDDGVTSGAWPFDSWEAFQHVRTATAPPSTTGYVIGS